MKKTTLFILGFGLLSLMLFQYCNKSTDEWLFCDGCPIGSWTGDYAGAGSYYQDAGNEITDGVEVQLEIENPEGHQFLIKVLAPGYY